MCNIAHVRPVEEVRVAADLPVRLTPLPYVIETCGTLSIAGTVTYSHQRNDALCKNVRRTRRCLQAEARQ